MIRFFAQSHLLPIALAGVGLIACSGNSATPSTATPALPVVDQTQQASRQVATTVAPEAQPEALPPTPMPIVITGHITDAQTDTPISATVELNLGQEQSVLSITSDNNGHFQLQDIEFPLTVRVNKPGYQLWKFTYNTLNDLTGNPVYKLNILLVPKVTQGLLVSAATNEPLADVAVTVNSNSDAQTTTTDASGAFELYKLVPNDLITVSPPAGYLPLEINFAGEDELALSLTPRLVTVTVKDSFSGSPISDGAVQFNQTLTGPTDAQGKTTLSPVPATGQIIIGHPDYISATVAYAGEETLNVSLSPAGLQAVVRGADTGQPLPQTTIYAGNTYFRTDDSGHFVLDTLPLTPTPIMIKAAGYHRTYAQLTQTGLVTDSAPSSFSGADGRWLAAAPCTQTPQPDGPPCLDIVLEPFQAKAIYVPLHYLRSRERMLEYLDFIAATELNAIVVDVKGDFGFIAWDSNVDLVSEVGADEWFTDTWLPLDEFIAEARARNIYTIARIVVFKDNPLAHGKPEWAAVREDGTVWIDGEELGWANPFREEVWEYNIELAKEVAEFGFDELNFDYIRFPSDGDVGAIVYEEENTLETRTAAIREFMTRLSDSLRPYGAFVSADVFGLTLWVVPTSDMRIGQRVIDVAPQVDYLAPMVYPSTFGPGNLGYDNPSDEPYNVVYRSQLEAKKIVPPYVKVRPWLQGYWYSFDEMAQLKQAATDSESAGWAWWNAGGKYDEELFEPVEFENGQTN